MRERAGVGVRVRRCRRAGRRVRRRRQVRTYVCVPERTGVYMGVRMRMYTYVYVCVCACVRARAWVDSSHPIIYQPPTERVCARMCAYTRDLMGA